ncbi:MAG: WYL domain-containing protein [Muribaculaceae bacterium]|nr:WYL domain-containing protein [Muribaculaceae bacterium]
MPQTKNYIVRCMVLDELLSDLHHYYDIHDFVEKVNEKLESDGCGKVTRRCIEKDIKSIEFEPFYAELERYQAAGKRCIRYKDPEFSIFKKKLSKDEKLLLKEVLGTLGQFDGLDNFTWLGSLASGLGVETTEPIIEFSTSPMGQSPLMGQLYTAISNKVVVEVSYHKFHNKTSITSILHPYKLKQYNNRWYLLGSLDSDGFIVNYPLDRINNVNMRPEIKYRENTDDISERFEDVIGVTVHSDRPVEKIILWASDDAYPYIKTKPMHGSFKPIRGEKADHLRKEHPKLNDGHFFQLECVENYELIRELCSFGKELLALSPKHIQDKVYERISSHNKEYEYLRT